jgi:hypothetical protein
MVACPEEWRGIMPIRQTRIFVRSEEPQSDWAETLVGRVFRPLTEEFENSLEWFWFSRYGSEASESGDCDISLIPDDYKRPLQPEGGGFHRSMRFRFNVADQSGCAVFEQRALSLISEGGYRVSDFRAYDFVSDTGNNRFLGVENRQPGRAQQRAALTTKFYWVTSKLVIDALVGPDDSGRFRLETNDDAGNNPRGSTFQSLLHLFCNITNVPTDVRVLHKSSLGVLGFGTFIYPPEVTPAGGWDPNDVYCRIRY